MNRLRRKIHVNAAGLFLAFMFYFMFGGLADALPSFDEVRTSYVKSDSFLLDRRGDLLHELRVDRGQRRLDWTGLRDISPALQEAVIHAEDKRFYEHRGVDYKSMGAAILQGLTSESLRGASTITMQLSSLLDRRLKPEKGKRSLWQKKEQVLVAWELEETWTKAQILEAYLNLIAFRGELQGITAASRALFGKEAHGLDRAESLILASFIRSPNAPFGEVVKRASHLAESMAWQINGGEIHSKARELFLGSHFLRPRIALAPHVARQLLTNQPPGSAVSCTLDARLQRFAIDRLAHHLFLLKRQNVKDGAVLVVENHTGDVLAYVSHSGDPSQGRFVDGVQAKRQAGSTLKPFLYALAFDERILTPASILDDTPLDVSVLSGIYQPQNYDSHFQGWVTARAALASSLNVPAVKVLFLVGIEPFLGKLRQLGVRGLNEAADFYGPSLALGSADVSLWELVNGYRTLANGGLWSQLRLVLPEGISEKRKIFSREAVFLISDILSDREARSITFGLESPLSTRFWTAVKTGTSKDMRDNWCVGYSDKYTVGVWVGNFSGEPMWNVSGITGAAPLWVEMMNFLHQNGAKMKGEPPAGVVRKRIQVSDEQMASKEEWFIGGTEPASGDRRTDPCNERIVYPPPGTVIALDPDIPPGLQKIFFIAQGPEGGLQWKLNGTARVGTGKGVSWIPKVGKYSLTLADSEDKVLDFVCFEVRGPEEAWTLRFEEEKGISSH